MLIVCDMTVGDNMEDLLQRMKVGLVKRCSHVECILQVRSAGETIKVKRCNHSECANQVVENGVCKHHGAEAGDTLLPRLLRKNHIDN